MTFWNRSPAALSQRSQLFRLALITSKKKPGPFHTTFALRSSSLRDPELNRLEPDLSKGDLYAIPSFEVSQPFPCGRAALRARSSWARRTSSNRLASVWRPSSKFHFTIQRLGKQLANRRPSESVEPPAGRRLLRCCG